MADIGKLCSELCDDFCKCGWVTGMGGSVSIRKDSRIFMTPSGAHKERIQPNDICVVNLDGDFVHGHCPNSNNDFLKLPDCAPLFLCAYKQRNAGAVIHSQTISSNLITALLEGADNFTISHQEMIKGIDGFGAFDTLSIPIIENSNFGHELLDNFAKAVSAGGPKCCAVLVRRHGMYVWGATWEQATRHAECLHYLFDVALEMYRLRIGNQSVSSLRLSAASSFFVSKKRALENNTTADYRNVSSSKSQLRFVILDIEGTTTPITFVKDVLFPYSREHMYAFLERNWQDSAVRTLVDGLIEQAAEDAKNGLALPSVLGDEPTAADVAQFCCWCIEQDRKITPLKKIQGLIWQSGYAAGALQSIVYEDVRLAVENWIQAGVRVCIYSSGSKQAQQLLFKHSDQGNMLPFLTAYFDTTVGPKQSPSSYKEILLTLGATEDPPSTLFVTDVLEEAEAAHEAGMSVIIADRPGNKPITKQHSFKLAKSFLEI